MPLNLYKKSERFVRESFAKTGRTGGFKHFLRTVHWVKALKPDADEALLIAAVAHDIERAFRDDEKMEIFMKSKNGFTDKRFLRAHQCIGAGIMADFLSRHTDDKKLIRRVKTLIENHEIGGTADQNILKDADSISFFENNVGHFAGDKVKKYGQRVVREKFDWMYKRVSSAKARKIARGWYREAVAKLTLDPNFPMKREHCPIVPADGAEKNNLKISIVKMTAPDLLPLLKLGRAQWAKDDWLTPAYLKSSFEQRGLSFAARSGNKAVGGIIFVYEDIVKNWIRFLIVAENYRRQGIGGTLVRKITKKLKPGARLFVDTGLNDKRTIKFYEKLGFKNRGAVKNLYGRKTAVFFEKIIK